MARYKNIEVKNDLLLLKDNGKFDISFVSFRKKNWSVEMQYYSIYLIGRIKHDSDCKILHIVFHIMSNTKFNKHDIFFLLSFSYYLGYAFPILCFIFSKVSWPKSLLVILWFEELGFFCIKRK